MKIVFVIPDMPGGGTERVVALLSNEYAKKGHSVSIMLFAGKETAYALDDRIEVISMAGASSGSLRIRMKRLKNMREYLKRPKGCLIYSFSTIGTGFVVLSTVGLSRKMLVSERTDPNSCDHKPYRNFFYRFAKVLVCQTREAADSFPGYLRRKTMVIPNPVDSKGLPGVYRGERKKKVVSLGRLEYPKNQELLIEAFEEFHKKFQEYTLHFYGKGTKEGILREMAAEKHLEDAIVFHGFCPDAAGEIVDSAMFVLSSDYEGVSNSMAEAMAMGIPVISTDCPPGGCRAYIENGRNGLLVPVGDAHALADAMKKVAEDRELAEKLSAEGTKIREKYPVEKIAEKMLRAAQK